MRRHAAAVLVAFAAATSVLGLGASQVHAECPYLPPWPDITTAIPSARRIIVGEIVTDFELAELHLGPNQGPREYALRITHVLRGEGRPGDLVDMQYLQANWPQIRFTHSGPSLASCTYLRADPGEVIALAYDALQPGGPMRNQQYKWIQPPTRYNAVGVIKGPGGNAGTDFYRQPVTLRQVRFLASLPHTDAEETSELLRVESRNVPLLPAIGLIGLVVGLCRFRGRRVASPEGAAADRGRRVAAPGDRTRRATTPA